MSEHGGESLDNERIKLTIETLKRGQELNSFAIHNINVIMHGTDMELSGEVKRLKAVNDEIDMCIKALYEL